MEWKKVKIGDICSKICSGGTPKSSNIAYYGGNIPWLNTKEVNFNRIYSTEQTITQEGLDNSAAKWIDVNSIIIAMYGATAGKVAITKIPLTTNQACCNLTIDNNIADYNFVYYAIVNNYEALSSLANGSAQQNLNSLVIKEFPLFLPPLPYQRRISSILSDYDSLIENYQRQISLLEESAKRIYKEWFVDFKFPGVEMPENGLPKGWQKKKLGEIIYVTDGTHDSPKQTKRGYPLITGKCILDGQIHFDMAYLISKDDYLQINKRSKVDDGDILFSNIGTIGNFCEVFGNQEFAIKNLFLLKPNNYNKSLFLYYWLSDERTKQMFLLAKNGSTQQFLSLNFMRNVSIVMPTNDIFDLFCKNVYPIRTQIKSLTSQIRLLRQNRDILLPRLMNGEIEIEG